MALSNDLVSQFVRVTNDRTETEKETTIVYGIAKKIYNAETGRDEVSVMIDGSEIWTPVSHTADVVDGERVTVMIKNHTATVTGNISAPSARVNDIRTLQSDSARITVVENLIANKVDTTDLNAANARIDTLVSDNVLVKENLYAQNGEIVTLKADNVTIKEQLTAANADIDNLETSKLDAGVASITYATIEDLDAANADIDVLEAGVADIDTLIFGSATGDTIQTTFSNAVIAQLGAAQIKSAMIESITAAQITAGDIITNNVRVMSEDGSLIISDETMQISDGNQVRVQIGKDASGDYSINVWDAAGALMFSKGGITDSAIKEAIIRNDMVSDTANISAYKLDIDSLFETINGSTNTIKSTQIYIDDKSQTLALAFKTLESELDGLNTTVTSQGTDISVIQGQIASKIWLQDINEASGEMSTQYSTLSQELDSFQSTVGNTYATKTSLNDLEIGGRNLYKRTGDFHSSYWGSYSSLEPYENDPSCKQAVCTSNYSVASGFLLSTATASQGFDFSDTTKTWTISAMMKGTADGQHVAITIDADRVHWSAQSIPNGTWKKMSWTFMGHKSLITFRFTSADVSTESPIYIAQVKVEEGDKATTWTPAPEDVQTGIDNAQAAAEAAQKAANKNAADMATLIANFNADIADLQTQIDGSITSWFYEVPPTLTNEPAVNWTTTELKNNHLGDLYYDTVTGYSYRWQVKNNAYSWQNIADTDVAKALADAKTAQDTADQKRRIFVATPTPPYDRGDLWVQGSGGDILRCNTAKITGQSYAASDWIVASKYTDDTTANAAKSAAATAQSTAESAQSDINNLAIGGRNLIVRSQSTEDAYYDQNGNFTPGIGAGTAAMTSYIPIKPNTQYTFSRAAGGGDFFRFNWYDSSKTYLGRKAITEIDGGAAGEFIWTSPSTAYFLLVSYPWDMTSKAKLERGNRATDWTPAPEDVQDTIDAVETRVENAETKITQNTNSITSVANRTTAVENKFSGYSTTSQMNSAIQQKADSITSSVASTYVSKAVLDSLSIGGTNLIRNSNFLKGTEYWTGVNATMSVVADSTFDQCLTFYTSSAGSSNFRIYANTDNNFTHKSNTKYTLSFWAKASSATTIQTNVAGAQNVTNHSLTTTWQKFIKTYTTNTTGSITFWPNVANVTIYLTNVKLELGGIVSDWSPSPKDIETRVSSAETKITQNSNSISAVATRTTTNENDIASLELTAEGLTAKVNAAKKQLYHSASGTSGVSGYIGICTFKITNTYQNRPILFGITNRGQVSSNISVCFSNTNTTDPTLAFIQADGGINSWIHKTGTSTWTLIIQKSESYDTLYVPDFTNNNASIAVTWSNTQYTALPTSNITAATRLAGKLAKSVVDNAAKTATNYLNFSSAGLVVGDHTGSTLKKNVLIDADGVDIRDGSNVLASFGANTIELGMKSEESSISLCGGAGEIVSERSLDTDQLDTLILDSRRFNITNERMSFITSSDYGKTTNDTIRSYGVVTSDSYFTDTVENHTYMSSDYTNGTIKTNTLISAMSSATTNDNRALISAEKWNGSGWTTSRVWVRPDKIEFTRGITVNGIFIGGGNNQLWNGQYYMTSGHTATLSSKVSAQPNGIVLVFSEYYDGSVANTAFHTFFVPKMVVSLHNAVGHCFQMTTSNLAYFATKYLYISDTKIVGHDNNSLTGSSNSGITRACNRFVLRYVIGV